jgi:tetratricopeptide (TPR) repeat protein
LGLGSDATGKGDYGAAKQLFQESLALFRELGNQERITQALGDLGYIAWLLGEYGEAEQLYRESLTLSSEVGDQRGIADALNCLALAGGGLEEHEQAKRMWLESLTIFKEISDPLGEETVLGNLAEFANYQGEYAEAIQLAQECLTISRKIDEPSGIAWALSVLGDAACGLRDLPGAKRYHHQALQVVATIRQPFYIPRHLVGIAALLAAEGESERALELLAMFSHHPTTWYWMKHYRAKPLVAALEAELPPEVFAAAWERGRTRDLDATVAELLDELEGGNADALDQPQPSHEETS